LDFPFRLLSKIVNYLNAESFASPSYKKTGILHSKINVNSYEDAVVAEFYGVGFEEITLSADVAAVTYVEFISMEGAYKLAQCVEVTLRQFTAGVGTFGGTGKDSVFL
jgi:hypothetical protein